MTAPANPDRAFASILLTHLRPIKGGVKADLAILRGMRDRHNIDAIAAPLNLSTRAVQRRWRRLCGGRFPSRDHLDAVQAELEERIALKELDA